MYKLMFAYVLVIQMCIHQRNVKLQSLNYFAAPVTFPSVCSIPCLL